ncbi:hypothetical protein L1987_00704 [Smallanthus sonchifolius]|uniref:Uncharacterized protein n=1 Tax=Smallanthus sonchifolius TaxID=185202 RepID=A0ACB9K394_9ASTR|nr:hypothetical protein L1987_00704 [Smallanthus sonchifolius]
MPRPPLCRHHHPSTRNLRRCPYPPTATARHRRLPLLRARPSPPPLRLVWRCKFKTTIYHVGSLEMRYILLEIGRA